MKRYTIDTNIVINLHRLYPREIFPGAWESIEGLIDSHRLCMCPDILVELRRGHDEVYNWAKHYQGFVCELTNEEVLMVAEISNRYPEWVQGEQNAADPWLIAHAAHQSRVIVTEEKTAGPGVTDRNQKVPNVAATLGVDTIKFLDLARAESWRFS